MTPNPATTVRLSESELNEIRTLIEQRSAILFDASRERFFSTRLLDFIEEKHLASGTDLLRHIKSSSVEYESLLEQLLTQETSFFRYPAVYEALEKRIVPEIEERKFWENTPVVVGVCAMRSAVYFETGRYRIWTRKRWMFISRNPSTDTRCARGFER